MNISNATAWWVMAGGLLIAEMALGTVQLLILALGAAAAALAAHAGVGGVVQVWIAAGVAAGGTTLWLGRRARRSRAARVADARAAAGLDVGQLVYVAQWQSGDQTRVSYRGSTWSARYQGQGAAQPGPHVIVGTDGNCLLLAESHQPKT